MQEGQRQLKQEVEESFLKMRDTRLDPNSDQYDGAFERRVADRWSRLALESLYQGKPEPTLKRAYDEIANEGISPKEREQISREALEKVSEKEQASSMSEGPSTTPRARESKLVSGFEELRQKTKEGDAEALMARIRGAEERKKEALS